MQAAELQSTRVDEQEEELEEIVVSAAKVVRSRRAMLSWLQRLVGHYSYEGYVELGSEGASSGRQTASGAGNCVPLDEIAVLCEARVQWPDITAQDGVQLPGGISAFAPAVTLYGFDNAVLAIRSLQVDSQGMANGGPGELRGNTLTTTTVCVDLPGDCKRVSRVNAQPDGKKIQIEVEILRDANRVAHFVFQLHRVGEVEARGKMVATGAELRGRLQTRTDVQESAEERRAEATAKMAAWLRRLVGRHYQFERITINGTLENYFEDGKRPDGTVATRYVDCVGIGSGPGVLCTMYSVVDIPGQEISYRLVMLVERGLHPNTSEIRVLMVGSDDSVGESSAALAGDAASWLGMSCSSTRIYIPCQRTMKISAPADRKYITWTYGSRIVSKAAGRELVGSGESYFYRLSPGDGIGPDGLPRTMAAPTLDIEVGRARPRGPR